MYKFCDWPISGRGPGPDLPDEHCLQVQAARADPSQAQGQAARPLPGTHMPTC